MPAGQLSVKSVSLLYSRCGLEIPETIGLRGMAVPRCKRSSGTKKERFCPESHPTALVSYAEASRRKTYPGTNS
jgi:hypothetical protein